MARKQKRPKASRQVVLEPLQITCRVCGSRMRMGHPIERALEERPDDEAEAIRGYCLAVRSALTDDGRPPLDADGLQLEERLRAIDDSIRRVAEKRGSPTS